MSAKQISFQNNVQELQELQYALDQFALTAVLHPAGVIISSNEKMLRVSGHKSDEMVRKPFHSFLAEDFRRFFIEHVLPLLNRGITWRGELCLVACNQTHFWTEATLVPILDRSHHVQRLRFIGFEVTERKTVEKALLNNSVFLTRLMEMAPIGFFLADIDGQCTYINNVWSESSGCRLRRALGDGWLQALHPDDREWVLAAWMAFVRKGQPFHCEYRYRHPSGRSVWVLAKAECMTFSSDTRSRYVRVEQDLTENKESEQVINEQRAQMVVASKMSALGEMAGGIAHEINNPLAILQLRARQILHLVQADSHNAHRLLQAAENIRQTTDRIAAIIRSLRAIARDGHGDPFELTSVRQILDHTLELCHARFESQDISLIIAPFDPELRIWCRSVEILQVLLNLLNNAFSAVEGLGEKWVEVRVRHDEDAVEFWITDSGWGVPAEHQAKLFQPFFTTKPVGSGTGLGLSISKAVALDHSGDLWLDTSSPHTRFILRIPQYPREAS